MKMKIKKIRAKRPNKESKAPGEPLTQKEGCRQGWTKGKVRRIFSFPDFSSHFPLLARQKFREDTEKIDSIVCDYTKCISNTKTFFAQDNCFYKYHKNSVQNDKKNQIQIVNAVETGNRESCRVTPNLRFEFIPFRKAGGIPAHEDTKWLLCSKEEADDGVTKLY